jgi:hypothetical protein
LKEDGSFEEQLAPCSKTLTRLLNRRGWEGEIRCLGSPSPSNETSALPWQWLPRSPVSVSPRRVVASANRRLTANQSPFTSCRFRAAHDATTIATGEVRRERRDSHVEYIRQRQ